MARINYTDITPAMMKRLIYNADEIEIGTALANEITTGQAGLVEVECNNGARVYTFNIKVKRTADTATTGVEHMGEHETFVKNTYKAEIECTGAYDNEGEAITPELDKPFIVECIEEQNNECDTIYATIK